MAANTISQLSTANTFQHWLTATQSLIGTANLLTNGAGSTFYANTRLEIGGVGASLNVSNSASISVLYSNNITVGNINVTSNIVHANVTQALRVGTTARVYGTLTSEGDTDLLSDLRVGGYIAANSNVSVVGNASIGGNVTIGGTTAITGNTTIGGDLTVTGNIVLDSIGFDDLQVAGSGSFGNTLSVTGATTVSTINAVSANISTNLTVQRTTTTDNLVVGNTATIGGNATVTGSITANELLGNANTIIYNRIAEQEGTALAFSIALG
jgi:predicted acyltransferase (DUF342 family)